MPRRREEKRKRESILPFGRKEIDVSRSLLEGGQLLRSGLEKGKKGSPVPFPRKSIMSLPQEGEKGTLNKVEGEPRTALYHFRGWERENLSQTTTTEMGGGGCEKREEGGILQTYEYRTRLEKRGGTLISPRTPFRRKKRRDVHYKVISDARR